MKKKVILSGVLLLVVGCSLLPVKTLIKQKDSVNVSKDRDLSKMANAYFWDNYHGGNYQNLDSIFYYLLAAYNQNPNDLETVAHLGFANAWAISERRKLDTIPPHIVDHATLAIKYFGEAYKLNPHDARILGFLADFKIIQGDIAKDKKLIQQGYFEGKKSINQWKEFNYFTLGYVLSQLPYDSWQFKKALEWQWQTLNACYCEKVDRENPTLKKYLGLEATENNPKRKRACWNSWIAPHNVEGFYLNMGDMLVKSGDYEKGIEIYNMIKEVPQYSTWPFQHLLEQRIKNAKENVTVFRKEISTGKIYPDENLMMINTSISCMACHQMSEQDKLIYQK